MSTSTKPSSPAPAPVDASAYHPLARLRSIIRAYVTLEGILSSLLLIAIWFWLTLALDFGLHYFAGIDLLDKAPKLRYVLFALFAVLVAGVLIFFVVRRLFREFSSASLALVLEKRYPELLGDRLITAVELADLKRAERQGYSTQMILKTMKEARERVDQVSVGSVFNWRRLGLIAWTFCGLTLIYVIAAYPLCVLLSIVAGARPDHLARIVLFNSLILLGCTLLFWLPFAAIYCWRRHRRTSRILLGGASVALLLTLITSAAAMKIESSMGFNEFSWRFYHTAGIAMNRNLKFGDERWPADDYHIALLDFPMPEKRVEVGKYMMVRAYLCRFIVADPAAPSRWRPAAWKDLSAILPGEKLPQLPLDEINDYVVRLASGMESSPVGYDASKLELPDAKNINVDLALAALADTEFEPQLFTPQQQQEFAALGEKLAQRAADPSQGGRMLRNVRPPEELKIVATRLDTQRRQTGKLRASDERNFVFQLDKPLQIDESIKFHVEGQFGGITAKSIERAVTLVLPPKLEFLNYKEYRPAYFYYLPPEAPRADTMDQRRKLLRNFRQELREIRTAAPPDQSVVNIAGGSELTISCLSDKPLREAQLIPRNLEFPGVAAKEELTPIHLKINPDGKSFTVRFASDGKPVAEWIAQEWTGNLSALTPRWFERDALVPNPVFPIVSRTSDFEVVFKDSDNMTSSRFIKVKPTDDKPPEVNLYVDVIRKVKNRFICTAKAEIPFAKESFVTDDHGLHKLELTYEYSSRASDIEANQKATMAAWLWASSPIMPTIGDYLYRREILLRTVRGQKVGPTIYKGAFAIDAFDEELKKFGGNVFPTLDQLTKETSRPLPDDFTTKVLNRYEFKNDDKPVVFDLREKLPRLVDRDAAGLQPIYDLVINARATDSNVLADADRTAENKDAPLVFEVVPEEILSAHISREEAELGRKLDDVVKRVETAQKNLLSMVSRLAILTAETANSEQTRLETILEAVSKSREMTAEIGNDYARILREYQVNRFPDARTKGLKSTIVDPLFDIQAKEFTVAEDALNKLHAAVRSANAVLAQPLTRPTVESMELLLKRLNEIRHNMGESLSFIKAREWLEVIYRDVRIANRDSIKAIEEDLYGHLLQIRVTPPSDTLSVEAGKTIKVPLKIRIPETLLTDPALKFEIASNSGLKINPSEIKLKDDSTSAEFELTAGSIPGIYPLRIIPTQGKPIDLKVVVK